MNKEIEKISKKLHELKMALYLGAYDRAENEESENEDPLITAADKNVANKRISEIRSGIK